MSNREKRTGPPIGAGPEAPYDAEGQFGRVGLVCRFKPFHLGQAAMLEALLDRSETLLVGIGSTNKYDVRNPFTFEETRAMIRSVLGDRDDYEFLSVPDLGNGPKWRVMVHEMMGELDLFVTANDYVRDLLEAFYPIRHPVRLVPPDRRVPVTGTMVRRRMARGEDWEALVPEPVAEFLKEKGLVERFRSEFGLETLAREGIQ